ncbi:glycosyltransferase [Microbacterium sp. NPDC055683]
MTAKKVLHVTQVYAGGISRAIASLIELAPDVEHHLLWAGNEVPDPTLPFASVHEMPQSPKSILAAIQRVTAVVNEVKPDIVHAHSSFGGVYTRLARIEAPILYEPHCYKFDDRHQPAVLRSIYRLAERVLARRSTRTVVLSPHEDDLAKSLDPNAQTTFLPNVATVEPSREHPATRFETARTVFMIGRVTAQKDPAYFAEVAKLVRAQSPDVRFQWLGDVDGEPDSKIERMLGELRAAGVEILGWLNGNQLAAALSRPGVYFHSARYEGFPLSVLDAAAFEHPIAVRSIPPFDGMGIPEAKTPTAAAQLILDILERGPAYEQAVAAAKHLNETMNRTAQRDALRALYASV